jgi:hypothetical protein
VTVRRLLFRRAVLAFGYVPAFFVAASVFEPALQRIDEPWRVPGLIVGFAVPFALLLVRVRCPQCRYLFMYIGTLSMEWGRRRQRIHFCPHCRLPLDTPVAKVVPRG